MIYPTLFRALMLCSLLGTASAQYPGWQHAGSLNILTTPEGANLPASASEENFPLLVRLDKEWFDFKQAQASGEDVRFASATGTPLAYQIDSWDTAAGTAAIWLRIPSIKGNARQEIKMFWGKPGAASESSGKAVFNESNGYVSVWHLDDPVRDEVGTTTAATDNGTTPAPGMIGRARHFDKTKGIDCGKDIATYPSGNSPHSSELWLRTDELDGGRILGWGVSKPNSIVQMGFGRPPHIRMDCFYSLAGIKNDSILPIGEWIHVIHTYQPGDSRLYINGRLDGSKTASNVSLTVASPAEMKIGGATYIGEMDEVRVSKVARSADWVKLQYENQKPMQTLLGTLVGPTTEFTESATQVTVLEGKSATFTARAGGALKLSWSLQRGGAETLVATDRAACTFDAGRVVGDQSATLRCTAVYPDGVKTKSIAIAIKEDIEEPQFTLTAPTAWDARTAIEIVPVVANLSAMRAKGAGDLTMDWKVSGIAVIKQVAPDKLILQRAQNSGQMTVAVTVSNGGTPTTHSATLTVTEPKSDPWIARTPAKDEQPEDNQFYARDDNNEGTLYYNGTLAEAADSVFLKVYADDKLIKTESQKPGTDMSYALSAKLKAGLIKYKVEFGSKRGNTETVLRTVTHLICGDAFIIQGQSNAVAYNYANEKDRPDLIDATSDWIRSYGSGGEAGDLPANGGWGNAVLTNLIVNKRGGVRFIGIWGMALAKKLVAEHKIPICILNGAVGGTQICQHLPDPADPLNTSNKDHSIYRNLLRRVVAAKLTHGIRGVLWHQGEADQGTLCPSADYNYKFYQQMFVDLSAAWKTDFPNLRSYYIYQIWPNACTDPSANDMLREVQRTLPRLYSNMRIMSTLGIVPGSSCHYKLAGYEQFAALMAPLVEQDHYGLVPRAAITAPDLIKASFTSAARNEIALEFGQDMAWNNGSTSLFFLDGVAGKVASGSAAGKVIKLQLTETSTAKTLTYLVGKAKWVQGDLVYGKNGIAALTFCEVPLGP
jgi:hypothetical protein